MDKKKIFVFICLIFVANFCFAYFGNKTFATYEGKDYEMDLDYAITQLKNKLVLD